MHPPKLNPIEPPWYGPVCPVVWEGRRRKASPYPDQSRKPSLGNPKNSLPLKICQSSASWKRRRFAERGEVARQLTFCMGGCFHFPSSASGLGQ